MTKTTLLSIACRIRLRAEDLAEEGDFLTAASDFDLASHNYVAAGDADMAAICKDEEAKCMALACEPAGFVSLPQAA